MSDPRKPSLALLVKLGSIARHADEGISAKGHSFDIDVLRTLLNDSEVTAWIEAMDAFALLPVKR
jgi:hypothetical protein